MASSDNSVSTWSSDDSSITNNSSEEAGGNAGGSGARVSAAVWQGDAVTATSRRCCHLRRSRSSRVPCNGRLSDNSPHPLHGAIMLHIVVRRMINCVTKIDHVVLEIARSRGPAIMAAMCDTEVLSSDYEAWVVAAAGTAICMACCDTDKKKKKRKQVWTRPWLRRRLRLGAYHCLTQELRVEDPRALKNFLRMERPQFDELLGKVENIIVKQDTVRCESISNADRLAITLRSLASGRHYYDYYCMGLHCSGFRCHLPTYC